MSYGIGGAGSVPQAGTFVAPVAGTKILLRRSDTQNKKPAAGDAEYGELFVNYHSGSPMLCFKDNANTIVEIRPLTEVELALGELTDVDTTGATNGMVLSYNGSTWVPVSAASIAIDVDLGYTAAADKGTVTNSAGDDATIPLATGTNAGLTLNNYTTAEKDKLAGVEDGAEANVVTSVHGRAGDVVAAEGDYDLGQMGDVDTAGATNGQLLRYNGTSWGPGSPAAVNVDLGYTPAADKGTVTNDSGTDAVIPLATGTNAGLSLHNYSQADKDKLDGYPDDPSNLPVPDLQAVTDAGATTTNQIESANDQGFAFTHLSNKLALKSQNLSANYAIRFPPTPAAADKRFLAAVGNNTSGDMDLDWVDGGFDPAVLDDYLPLAGGHMTGGVSSDVGTVPNGTGYELHTHNFWEIGAVTVANPITTDLKAGQSGLFVLRDAPIAWGTFYKFKGGTPPAPTSYPAVCPFYVNSGGGETYVGPAIEVQP